MIGVDIGGSAIKVVELGAERGRAVLKNYGEIALGPYMNATIGQAVSVRDEQVGDILKDILQEANITTRRAVMAIPLGSTLLSFIDVPTGDEKQLAQIIPTEARKYIPVPISEVVLDWWVLPQKGEATHKKDDKKTTEVVISAIHNEKLNSYQRIQASAHLAVESYEIEIFSSIRSVIGRDMSPVMVLDIGAGMTKLAMVEYGIVKSYHIINKGSQDVTLAISSALEVGLEEAEQIKREYGLSGLAKDQNAKEDEIANSILGYIFSESEAALVAFGQKYGSQISKVIMVGGGALLKGLQGTAQKYFQIPVELGDPFGRVESPEFMKKTLKEVGPEFAVALGAALKGLGEG